MLVGTDILPFIEIAFEGLFYLTTLVFVIFSLALAYHWFSYGTNKSVSSAAMAIYLLGSAPFFMAMAISFVSL